MSHACQSLSPERPETVTPTVIEHPHSTRRVAAPPMAALDALARLLEYPDEELEPQLKHARTQLDRLTIAPVSDGIAPAAALGRFTTAMLALSATDREELFTATFELTPACVPYVSIHLFGEENFKRGELMAALRARYAETGFEPGIELPDHLSVLLRYTARTGMAEQRELLEFCLLKPLARMMDNLTRANPYRDLLDAVHSLLRALHPDVRPALSPLEEMQRHGPSCDVLSAGCGCGAGVQPDDRLSANQKPARTARAGESP
jgi:nitrate reductase molybdenum cofactor assembly chaperone NarJ/NarW